MLQGYSAGTLGPIADLMAEKKHPRASVAPKPEVIKLANETRALANSMTDVQREDAFRHGMQLIYGGPRGIPAKTGRP